jgi:hypothetical protein
MGQAAGSLDGQQGQKLGNEHSDRDDEDLLTSVRHMPGNDDLLKALACVQDVSRMDKGAHFGPSSGITRRAARAEAWERPPRSRQ